MQISRDKFVKGTVAALLVLGVGVGLFLVVRTGAASQPTRRDVEYATRQVRPANGDDFRVEAAPPGLIAASGVVEPREREAHISPEVGGVVEALLVTEGQVVPAGAPLVQLRAGVEAAAVRAAEADVASARAQLDKALRGPRAEDVSAAEAELGAARARAEMAAETLTRTQRLFERQASTREELSQSQAQARADEQTARALEARHAALARGSRSEDIAAARAALAQAEARLSQTKITLARLTVRAPFAGEVLQLLVRPGEYVNPAGEGVVKLADTSALRVRLDIDERDVGKVARGASGFVRADGYAGQEFQGRVVEVGRRMGRKNVRTDEPTERKDVKILEVLLELDGHPPLPQGLRVSGFVRAPS
jgi:multidrug resistance efflux pump